MIECTDCSHTVLYDSNPEMSIDVVNLMLNYTITTIKPCTALEDQGVTLKHL